MIQKLRRQSVKASSIKGKFGLGPKPNAYRSRSFIAASPTPEHHHEIERFLFLFREYLNHNLVKSLIIKFLLK